MSFKSQCLALLIVSVFLVTPKRGYSQEVLAKDAPVEESVVLSVSDENSFIEHRIANRQYEIVVNYKKSMIGIKKLDLSVKSVEAGTWAESTVSSGSVLEVKLSGKKEPRGCEVSSRYTAQKDPAESYVLEVVERLKGESGVLDSPKAKSEIDRLVNQYGQASDHVLKLPRSASSRLNPKDTLRRLCRWIVYDKLFKQLQLDLRPTASETDAKKTYDQLLVVLRGGSLPNEESDRLISDEELQRIHEAFRFTYSIRFTPNLIPGEPDQNWRSAGRVSFVDDHVGRVVWRGMLGQGHQSTAWLAFREKTSGSVEVSSADSSDNLKWLFVKGRDNWRYVRLINAKKAATPFQLRIVGDKSAPEIEISHSESDNLQFPF